ncbi:hypothetical protein VHEMI05438 [[Torrubiella] hemipterigena]|uniref:N-acetyltransferase domain-containing protein n=1 Tax=[Torrubiella] hemipterigena TaxID=1531966 RepID=A0A0A1TH05_9HYPO|nr:hypothetical protein VHEMI05438 [[Torrubiella] hemipterigena]
MWRIIRPQDKEKEFILECLAKRLPMRLLGDRDRTRHVKAVDFATGQVVGYIRWTFPKGFLDNQPDELKWLSAQVPNVTKQELEAFEAIENATWWEIRDDLAPLEDIIHTERERLIESNVYADLDLMAVHPDFQRKGIATALIQDGIEHIKKLNLSVFVQAWSGGREVYAKAGFQEIGRCIQDDTAYGGEGPYHTYFMTYN